MVSSLIKRLRRRKKGKSGYEAEQASAAARLTEERLKATGVVDGRTVIGQAAWAVDHPLTSFGGCISNQTRRDRVEDASALANDKSYELIAATVSGGDVKAAAFDVAATGVAATFGQDPVKFVDLAREGKACAEIKAKETKAYLDATVDEPLPKRRTTKGEKRASSRAYHKEWKARGGCGEKDQDEDQNILDMSTRNHKQYQRQRARRDVLLKQGYVPQFPVHERAAHNVDLPSKPSLGRCTYATGADQIRPWTRIKVQVAKKDGNKRLMGGEQKFKKLKKESIFLKNDVAGSPDEGRSFWNSEEAASAAFHAYFAGCGV